MSKSINERLTDLESQLDKLKAEDDISNRIDKKLEILEDKIDNFSFEIDKVLKNQIAELDFVTLNENINKMILAKFQKEYKTEDKDLMDLINYVSSPQFTPDISDVLQLAKLLNRDEKYLKEKRIRE